jgi:type IV secretory pathway TraG/TraD family ATPase VirD4
MAISRELVYGSMLETNQPSQDASTSLLHISGQYKGCAATFGVSEDEVSKHTLLVGGTGSGKTNLFYHIVDQIKEKMTHNDVMLIFDSKGDFYSKFFSPGDVVIGNSKKYRTKSEKWSIYDEIIADGNDRVSVAQNTQEICKSLFAEKTEKNNSNPFFPDAARDLFASIMIAFIRGGASFSNKDLKDYLDSTDVDGLRSLLGTYKDLASVGSYIGGKAGAQTQGVLAEMYSATRDILTGVFADVGSFSIRNFVRSKGKKTLFLEYDLAIGDVLSPVYTLLFDLALKEALGRTATQGNVYLIADELKLLPHLRHLEDGINFGRSLGVKIFAGLQSIDQLNATYGSEEKARNIISGFSSVYAFRSNDFITRQYIRELFGRNVIFERYPIANGQYCSERREGFVVEDWDLTDLAIGEAVVGLPQRSPFRFKFDLYK